LSLSDGLFSLHSLFFQPRDAPDRDVRQINMKTAFICHSSANKPEARSIGLKLQDHGIHVWIDEACLNVGDVLLDTISSAIDRVDYLVALISNASIQSSWVRKELSIAMTKEINGKRVVVIPVRLDDCLMPPFLSDKLYADMRDPSKFAHEIDRIATSILHSPTEYEYVSPLTERAKPGTSHILVRGSTDAFFGNASTSWLYRLSLYFLIGGAVILAAILIGSRIRPPPPHALVVLVLSAGLCIVAGIVGDFSARLYRWTFASDANLLLDVEVAPGWETPFTQNWRKQRALGKHNSRYLLALYSNTFHWILRNVAIIGLLVGCTMLLTP